VPVSPDYENRYSILAHNILEGQEYGTGADFEYPPLYPAFLALHYTLFGEQIMSIQIFQIFFDLVICVILFSITSRLKNRKIGYISMILWGFYPMAIWQAATPGTETLFTALIMLFMFLFISSYKNQSPLFACLAGISIGIAMLIRPMLVYFPLFLLLAYKFNIRDKVTMWRLYFTLLFGIFFTLSPWIIRNYIKHNEIIVGSKLPDGQGSSRMLFEGSDKDFVYAQGADRYQISNIKRDSLYSIYLKPDISKNDILFKVAAEKITYNPFLYLKLIFYKIWKLFTFTTTGTYDIYLKIINVPIMILTFFGIYSIRHGWRKFSPIILLIFYFIGVYSLFISMLRYLMPAFPFIILLSAIGIDSLITITNKRNIKFHTR